MYSINTDNFARRTLTQYRIEPMFSSLKPLAAALDGRARPEFVYQCSFEEFLDCHVPLMLPMAFHIRDDDNVTQPAQCHLRTVTHYRPTARSSYRLESSYPRKDAGSYPSSAIAHESRIAR